MPIIISMYPSVEQTVRDFAKAARKFRKENNTRAKARQFLLRVGILEKHAKSPSGVRLAKPYRS